MMNDLYNEYLTWFENHFGFNPVDNEFKKINAVNELIALRADIERYLNQDLVFGRIDMEASLDRLKIITFNEYKESKND